MEPNSKEEKAAQCKPLEHRKRVEGPSWTLAYLLEITRGDFRSDPVWNFGNRGFRRRIRNVQRFPRDRELVAVDVSVKLIEDSSPLSLGGIFGSLTQSAGPCSREPVQTCKQ
jgi:hypothetical protein